MTELEKQKLVEKIIAESPNKKCISCDNEYFDRATLQKVVSPLMSGTGKEEILLIEVLVCRKCGQKSEQNKIIS